jgi:hypothetical protein
MRGPYVHARAMCGLSAHARTKRGPDALACTTCGTGVSICVFACAMHGLDATTSGSCARALPRRVVGLPPRHYGS